MRWWASVGSLILVGTVSPGLAFAEDPPDWGLQLGGPGAFEIMYRPRIAGPVLLELGAFAVVGGGFVGNGSLGLVVELARPPNIQPYIAVGGGGAGGCGEGERGLGCSGIVFGYSRTGLGFTDASSPANLLTLDLGAWGGAINSDERGYRPFVIPMAGLGYYW